MIATRTKPDEGLARGNLGNKVFTAVLVGVLVIFLLAIVLVLLSTLWYLQIARGTNPLTGRAFTGWQVFLETLKATTTHDAIRLSLVSAFLTMLLSMVFAIPIAYLLSRYRIVERSRATFIGQYVLAGVVLVIIGVFRLWLWSWEVVIIGLLLAFLLLRYHLSLADIIDTVLDFPIVVPPPVVGVSLLMFFWTPMGETFNRLTPHFVIDLLNGFLSLVLGHSIPDDGTTWVYTTRGIILAQFFVACSFGVRAVKAAFDTIGTRHEDVARTLGCTRRQAFFKVVLPMAASGLVTGAVMTWARAIAEFGPVLFLVGTQESTGTVLPVRMFLHYSTNEMEAAVSLVVIMVALAGVMLLVFKKMGAKGYIW